MASWGTNNPAIRNGVDTNGLPIIGTPKAKNYVSYLLNRSQEITADLTLTKDGGPYVVNDVTVNVKAGATLTLESGVVVKFYDKGRLSANGEYHRARYISGQSRVHKPHRRRVWGRLKRRRHLRARQRFFHGAVSASGRSGLAWNFQRKALALRLTTQSYDTAVCILTASRKSALTCILTARPRPSRIPS